MSLVNKTEFNLELMDFLANSPTPFHAVRSMSESLNKAGFECLAEQDAWQLHPGKRYYVTRNNSSIIAFVYGRAPLLAGGIRILGAHTDSPCLKVKPQPELNKSGYFQLGVEVYGGALLNPWFDRDLSLAGRISYRTPAGAVEHSLLDFNRAIAVIPSLAIHLDREANTKRSVNKQTDLPPVLMRSKAKGEPSADFRALLKSEMQKQGLGDVDEVLDYELSFYDVQRPALVGLESEFLTSARLDNLLSCYIGLQALLSSDGEQTALLVCNDHEEVGSMSACGAQGPMLEDFLSRVLPDTEARIRTLQSSMMVSADNAHGVHPNYADRHDANHGPKLNDGPVIKVNANQSYATNSQTSALFRHWCHELDIPVQTFVTRTDMGCGSTIGPIATAEVGVRAIDIGVPTFAMHSVREMAGVADSHYLYRVLCHYLLQTQLT